MKTIGAHTFPETQEEANNWKPFQTRRMLHRGVMCVARSRIEGTWRAYCFSVAGKDHDKEEGNWACTGVKLPEDVARVLFPRDFSGIPYSP